MPCGCSVWEHWDVSCMIQHAGQFSTGNCHHYVQQSSRAACRRRVSRDSLCAWNGLMTIKTNWPQHDVIQRAPVAPMMSYLDDPATAGLWLFMTVWRTNGHDPAKNVAGIPRSISTHGEELCWTGLMIHRISIGTTCFFRTARIIPKSTTNVC